MARVKSLEEKAKSRLLQDIKIVNRECPNLCESGRNLTALYLTGKLDEVYNRDSCVEAIQRILLRKSKANALLTGPAGCGKTAIAERLAAVLALRSIEQTKNEILVEEENYSAHQAWLEAKNTAWEYSKEFNTPEPEKKIAPEAMLSEVVLFELSLTTLVSGTRYRGDFEERVKNILAECKNHPNIVLFIDEIHQLVKTGASDGSEGMAQMLKPALARKDISVIGATTTEEAKYIWQDKALARRFNEVKINPLRGTTAHDTAVNILKDYSKYHQIETYVEDIPDILRLIETFLPSSVFPDNFINVVDETLAGARFDGLSAIDMTHYKATLSRMAGVVIV